MSRARKTPPPALSGLIRQLPAGAWSTHERAMFLEAFTRCLDLSIPLNDGIVGPDDAAPVVDKVIEFARRYGPPLQPWQEDTLRRLADADDRASGAHAPDPPPVVVVEGEHGSVADVSDIDDVVWVRSTGRGEHDVMMAGNPAIVLASVMFREGVKGRSLALERFAAALASVSQDVQP